VTRIIGGHAGGRRLQTPKGDLTRPTADRVREALFSALESTLGSLSGLRFLDLYAGSGAVGLEAWSRGAAAVLLVERDRRTAALVRANATTLGCRDARVVTGSVRTVLTEGPVDAPYDVVFADPPYATADDRVGGDLQVLVDAGWLAGGAVVVVERPTRAGAVTWPAGLVEDRSRTYGETALWSARAALTDEQRPGETGLSG
jgi:16S rRNA (guanine966-N2)-methyltransferase